MGSDLNDLKPILAIVADGGTLTSEQAETAFDTIMSGDATPSQIGAFLMALRLRGETVDEITAAARIMRSKALPISAPAGASDVVGTGGDGAGTRNISTGAALGVAGAGVPVAKHGNLALSSKSGAADVLAAHGVNINADMRLIERSIADAGIGFMMAPRHHSATRHVAGPRVELATRTVFNILGPLSNPAGVKRLLVGVYEKRLVEPMAYVLANLGAERAWVVHGAGGLDELTSTDKSFVAEFDGTEVRTFDVTPEDAGLTRGTISDLKGGNGEFNAEALRAVLNGAPSTYRDTVVLTASGALIVAGKADELAAGGDLASKSIETGRAMAALEHMVEITNEEFVGINDEKGLE